MFRLYTNYFSRATRGIAGGAFITGMLLVGFGMLIIALPELFAALAAAAFFIAGLGCIAFAVKTYLAIRKINRHSQHIDGVENAYRENVNIHIDRHFDD